MTDLMQRILGRKRAMRRELAALQVGEKLRILAQMLERDRKIAASRPPKPANPPRPPLTQSRAATPRHRAAPTTHRG